MNKKLVLLGTALLMTAATASAQKRVTGRVVDTDGAPVIGATVRVEGGKGVASTDSHGNFTLQDVPASAKSLKVTSIGKAAQTVSISGNVKVVMKDSETVLDEAYVVAYGRATKQSFTGAAAKIKGEKIEQKSTTEVTQALQGEVAGVQVITSDGNPGSSGDIYIRGLGSLYSSSQPLIVLDGIPYGGSFSSIDPKDIASVDIMKDATAAALYGSRGANGVVIVTTKRGQKGKLSIGADVKYAVSGRWLPTYETIDSPERFTELTWEGLKNSYALQGAGEDAAAYASLSLFNSEYGGIPEMYNMWNTPGDQLIDPTTGRFYDGITRRYTPENWEDELFRTGQKVDGSINITGGNDRSQFYTSLGYTKDKGYVVGADFQRFNVRSNIDTRITNWLKGTVNLAYTNMESNAPVQDGNASNNALQFSNLVPCIYPVFLRDADGNLVEDPNVGGWMYDYGNATADGRPYAMNINPAGAANLDINRSNIDQFTGNGNLEATFLKDFKFAVNLGYTYYNSTGTTLTNPYYGDAKSANGRLDKSFNTYRNVTGNQILSWAHTYGGVHHVSAFAGHESYWNETQYSAGSKYNLVQADGIQFGNAVSIQDLYGYSYGYSLDSYFGQVAYDYDNKYFFNAAIRADGSSRFADGNRWGTFGSVSAAWNITKENFMQDITWLRNLKLKGSWGLVGNQSLSTGTLGIGAYYPYATIYGIGNMNDAPSFSLSMKGNKDLTWEKTSNFNVGLEFNIADVIEGEFDYFNKLTYDMLFMKQVSPSLGYTSIPVNDGEMRNQGFEFNIIAHLIKTQDVSLDFRLNGAHYTTEMELMPMDEGKGQPQDYYKNGYFAWQKGRSVYDFYLREYMGVDAETGQALYKQRIATFEDGSQQIVTDQVLFDSQYKGQNVTFEDGTTTDGSEALYDYVGETALPTLTGGFGLDLRVKDFTFGATFTYALGGKAMDYTYQRLMGDNTPGATAWHKDIENRWQKAGDITDVPMLSSDSDEGYYANAASTRFLTSRSYLALSNVRVAYNVPEYLTRQLGDLNGVQIYASGENLFLLSARKGFMPGTSFAGTSSDTQYLPSSNFTIGLKLNF